MDRTERFIGDYSKNNNIQKKMKAIIIGATSGIGLEVAKILDRQGVELALAGRRLENLQNIQSELKHVKAVASIDITQEDAPEKLEALIQTLGGVDLYFHSSGIGFQNPELDPSIELNTVQTNCLGLTRMVDYVFKYFLEKKVKGHIAVITSIARTKGIGLAPSYSATKKFQGTYLQALAQLATIKKAPITFSEIRPGFVATELLKHDYPMLMKADYVAEKIVKGIRKHKRIITVDWRYKMLVAFWKMIPDCLWERWNIAKLNK